MSPKREFEIPENAVPDDVFKTPLFKMERFGRFIRIDTHRSEQQHKEFIQNVVKHRPELLKRATDIRMELRQLIHLFSSLDLLACLLAKNLLHDPNTYCEYESRLKPHLTEYLAMLELCDPAYQLRSIRQPGEEVERAQSLLEELFSVATLHYQTEHISESAGSVPPPLQELRTSAISHNLAVRSPAYHDHWVEVLTALFSPPTVAKWLENHSLSILDVLKCVHASAELLQSRLVARVKTAREERGKLQARLREFRRGSVTDGTDLEILQSLAAMNGKNRHMALDGMLGQWVFFALSETWSVTVDEFAKAAAVSTETSQAFLNTFSLSFGQPEKDDPWPSATHELQVKPFISYQDKFLLAAPHLLLWAVKPNLEAKLQGTQGAPWKAYEHSRSRALVEKGLKYLSNVMPTSNRYQELFYNFDGKRCELDGLLIFDRYLVLLEAKAGVASLAGRRGAPKSIASDLKDLVRDPTEQVTRAKEFINSTDTPVFSLKDGSIVTVDKKRSSDVVLISLTLDDMGIFTSDLGTLQKSGLLDVKEPAWAIFLPDLKIVTEILSGPAQFFHYVRWRCSLLKSEVVFSGKDEVNWLGIYLTEGPAFLTRPHDADFLTFTTYTTQFDDYFLFKMGQRTKVAKRPSQAMPEKMFSLINQIETSAILGYTKATEALLDLTFEERNLFGKMLRRVAKQCDRGAILEGSQVAVKFVAQRDIRGCEAIAEETAKELNKTALVLSFADGLESLLAWSVCPRG